MHVALILSLYFELLISILLTSRAAKESSEFVWGILCLSVVNRAIILGLLVYYLIEVYPIMKLGK